MGSAAWMETAARTTSSNKARRADDKESRRGKSVGQASRLPWPRSGPGVWAFCTGGSDLPEGDLRIARQFTAGFRFDIPRVPKGRLNPSNVMRLFIFQFSWQEFSRPFGT